MLTQKLLNRIYKFKSFVYKKVYIEEVGEEEAMRHACETRDWRK